MIRRNIARVVVLLLSVTSVLAQKSGSGAVRSTAKVVQLNESYTVNFQPTPVNSTVIEDCFFNCFFLVGSPVESCNYSGTIDLVKPVNPPFRTTNLRKGVAGSNCNGTPVTLPITLQPGEWLLQDFV